MAEPTYEYYKNVYLDTHLKLVQQSIMMAQNEFDSKLKQIQFYEKQLAKMRYGTDGTGSKFVDRANLQYRSEIDAEKRKDKAIERIEAEGQLPVNFVSVESNIKSLIGGGKNPEAAVKQVIQEMQLDKQGGSDYQRRLISKQLVQVAGSAARAKGKSPSPASLNQAVSAAMGVTGFQKSADQLKAEEIKKRTAGIEPLATRGSFVYGGSRQSRADLQFGMGDVEERDGVLVFKKDGTPLDVEQERVYRLQDKIRRLETNLESEYGEDYNIDTIIEKGRDIYRRNYAPISDKELDNIYRENFMSGLSKKQKELFLAFESVDANDKRVKDFMKGRLEQDDPMYKFITQVLSAGKQGQEIDPVQLANTLFDDPDMAREAVGVALQVQLADLNDKKIKPAKEQVEKEEQAEKTKKDFGDRLDFDLGPLKKIADEGFGSLFAGRMKGPKKEETVLEPVPLEEQDIPDEFKPVEAQGVDPALLESQGIKVPITQLEIGTEVKKNPNFKYGYEVISIGEDGVPVFKTTGTAAGRKMNQAMIDEALIAYQKELERLNAEQK